MSMMPRAGCRIYYLDGGYADVITSYETAVYEWQQALNNDSDYSQIGHYTSIDTNRPIAIRMDTISRIIKMGY